MKRNSILLNISIAALVLVTSCGKKDSKSNPMSPSETTVTVTISPTQVTLSIGETQQFTATITGAEDTTVTWSLGSNQGTITATGLYTAPVTLSGNSITVAVKAVANAEPTTSASANVTVEKPQTNLPKTTLAGFGASQFVRDGAEDGASLAAQAVFEASIQNGGNLVTTGTLTQAGQNSSVFNYSASPDDRLRIIFANGNEAEFKITAMNGDFSNNAETFIKNDHNFALEINFPNIANLQVSSTKSNGARQASVFGEFVYDGTTYTVQMQEQGTYNAVADVGSAEYRTEDQTAGTITAPGFELTINEYYYYKSLYVENFVENTERRVNNTWTQNGNSYSLSNIRIRKAFFNTKPSELESYWIAEGVMTENGVTIGQVSAGIEDLHVKIWMQLPNEKIVLEEYLMN